MLNDQNTFIDWLTEKFNLKNDAALCRHLKVEPPVISKIRHGRLPVGASFIIKVMEVTDMKLSEIKPHLPSIVDMAK